MGDVLREANEFSTGLLEIIRNIIILGTIAGVSYISCSNHKSQEVPSSQPIYQNPLPRDYATSQPMYKTRG